MKSAEAATGIGAGAQQCKVCGATTRLGETICLGCFLNEGLEGDGEGSAEMFERVLAEADVADAQSRIGNYQVISEIGRGGMGAVFLAERVDKQFEQQVAIKLIKRGMDTDAVLRHFRNERQILANFDHPNIARLFDGGTTDSGLPYFVMEYVEGVPINDYCAQRKLSINERLKLFQQVCAAVSYAHRHLVIHRDIKRSNILVTSEGVPKLLDFGIAKILQQQEGAQTLATMTGLRLMTPEYASPEQIRGEPVTTASDVYSLGVVLYELLTGMSPYRFTAQSTYEIARTVGETDVRKPSTALAGSQSEICNPKFLTGDLDNIVLMALRKEPERRYQTVERFSEDIQRHLNARPVSARKDTIGYRVSTFVRRNRAATAAGILVVLTLIGGIIATTWQAQRARLAKARAERRFNDVRQLARSVLFDYYDAIKNLPGATPVRDRLVKDALNYLDSLAREAGGDPALQRELASAYERVGDVRGETYGANLGDRVGATESYAKALSIREALVAAAPDDVQNQRDLAASHRRIGNQEVDTTDTQRGLDHLRKALAICSKLATDHPRNAEIQHDLADTCNELGLALESTGDIPAASEHHRKALNIYTELLAADPKDRPSRRALSVSYENLGRALFLSNDAPAALENNQKALELRETLAAEEPTNADYRRILGVSYQNKGDYLAWMKDPRGALESFQKKFAIDEQSFAADPANVQARGDLAYGCSRLADLLTELGDPSNAIPYYRRALEIYEKNLAADPADFVSLYRGIAVRAQLAGAHAKIGDTTSAREEGRKTRDFLKSTADAQVNVSLRRIKIIGYISLGDTFATLATKDTAASREHWRVAHDMYQTGLDMINDLRKAGVIEADELTEVDSITRKIADCDAALAR